MSTILTLRHLSKTFPGQVALDDVDLDLAVGGDDAAEGEFDTERGRVHALVGQNGSGKSTLIKILAGYHQPDPGSEATFAGRPLQLGDARATAGAGIRFVHQDLGLVDAVSAVENLALGFGYRTRRGRRIDWRAETRHAEEALASLGFDQLDVRVPVGALAPSQKTAVAIARALQGWEEGASLLVLDEPTASLPGADVARLFEAIRRLKDRGVAILYVSHHLDEVFEIADDVTVLRDGRRVTTVQSSRLDRDSLIELIVGHAVESGSVASDDVGDYAVRIEVRRLAGGNARSVSFDAGSGEIVGIAGITGSGREDVVGLITGQTPRVEGHVRVDGTDVANYAPGDVLRSGISFVPADRVAQGIIPLMGVRHNLTLGHMHQHFLGGRLRHGAERGETDEWIGQLDIKTAGADVPITTLSGGNQQKVLFGKALRRHPGVLILDEPTRGIDVGAKEEIHSLIDRAAAEGAAVVVASTDTDELVRVCNRVLILVDGEVVEEIRGRDISTERIEHAQLQSA